MSELSVTTANFDENQSHGLMICGTNYGRNKRDERLDAAGIDRSDPFDSFFSDKRVNDTQFRNTLVKWFLLWGLPLEQDEARAGALERSIVQTNWLPTVAHNVRDIDVVREAIDAAEPFLELCKRREPRLLLLLGAELATAIAAPALRERVEQVFGPPQGEMERIERASPGVKSYRIRRLRFERTTVLCCPHPTGAWGITDQFIAAQDEVKVELATWWGEHQEHLKRKATV